MAIAACRIVGIEIDRSTRTVDREEIESKAKGAKGPEATREGGAIGVVRG